MGRAPQPIAHYFADSEGDGEGLQTHVDAYRRRQRRNSRYLLLTAATLFVLGNFIWGYRDLIGYVFAGPAVPTLIDDVAGLRPTALPHNGYVRVTGITEHRGLTQERVRGLGVARDSYWYYRLLGGGGLFVEVPAEAEITALTRVTVEGRIVDTAVDVSYAGVVGYYNEHFLTDGQGRRILQVGVRPREGRTPFVLAFGFAALLLTSNLWVIARMLRARASRPR